MDEPSPSRVTRVDEPSSNRPRGPRTVLLVDSTGYEALGGAAMVVDELIDRADPSRYRPVLACLTEGAWPELVRRRGVPAYSLPRRRLRSLRSVGDVVLALARIVRRHDVSLIHASENSALLYATLAARLTRRPVVWHIHSPFMPRSRAERATATALRALAPAHIVFTSPSARRKSRGLPEVESSVVFPGVDLARCRSGVAERGREALGLPPAARLVSMFARMDPAKGQRAFVQSLGQLLPTHPDLYGAACGPGWPGSIYWSKIEALRDEQGVGERLLLPGNLRPPVKHDVVAASEVVVHPSVAESFGLAVLEAMAAGKPVVAMDADGPQLLIEDGVDGLLVPVNDVAALSAATAKVLDDPELAGRLGANAARAAERYRIEDTVALIQAVWDGVLPSRP